MALYRPGIATFFYQNGIAGVSCPLFSMPPGCRTSWRRSTGSLADNLSSFSCQQNCGNVNSDNTLLVALPTA